MTDKPGQKHTPGPWIVFDCDEELEVIPAGRSGGIALITSQENRDANARLIAAAPMMLEALRTIVANIREYERINNLASTPGRKDCWDSVTNACVAIAKAEGRK